ncbi:MAG: penicillin-binding transpeptidase domain-containing protein [Bacillota bacterium]
MHKIDKSTKRRLKFALVVVTLIVFFLGYRLIRVQVIEGADYKRGALQQWTKAINLKSDRGIIYDRKGRKLVVNVTSFTVWASPTDVKEPEQAAMMLESILQIDSERIYESLKKDSSVVKLKQWITRDEAEKIRGLEITGISIIDDNKRYYPFGNFASYVIGFTDIDNNGLYGIERVYDEYLSGVPGVWVKATDRDNRQLPYGSEKVYNPKDGTSVVLTIDETIQGFAEEAAQEALIKNKAKSVSIIVMDPHTGEILAMANKPDYDPNNPRMSLDEETNSQWETMPFDERQKMWFELWRNYAINDLYEPGSTFKIVTAAAALEEATADLNTHYYCNGFIRDIPGVVLRCSSWYNPHEDQDFSEAFSNSCNVAFVNMARDLGKEKLYEYIKAFGFGEVSGIDLLGEGSGIIPADTEVIREVNLATLSYGHGIAVTPIQMVNAIAVVGNGGNLMTPHIVKSLVDSDGRVIRSFPPDTRRQVISETTSNEILDMLELTVLEGTGRKAYVPGYRIGGKTGTAQKIIDGRYVEGKYISSFGGVAPVDDPKLAVLVIVDEPTGIYYGGTVAGPPAAYVIENTLNYMEIPRKFTENELKATKDTVMVPDVRNLPIGQAGKEFTDLELKYTTEYEHFSTDTLVIDQYPSPGEEVIKGSIIDLYLEDGSNNPVLSNEEQINLD